MSKIARSMDEHVGGQRLTDAEARKRFLASTQGKRATSQHTDGIAADALRHTRTLAGKLPPVFPTVQTVGTRKNRAGYTAVEAMIAIGVVSVTITGVALLWSLIALIFRAAMAL